jgi:hypothetical protein
MRNVASEIESKLVSLIGAQVRIQARRFSPDGRIFTFSKDLVFPNGLRADNVPVFFEGELTSFERRIGVFIAVLGTQSLSSSAGDGLLTLRGKLSAIIAGPAIVELEYPFHVERIPSNAVNYWGDIRLPAFQFELCLE